jgi:hypothetical protein
LCFCPWKASEHDPPMYSSCMAGITVVHHAQLFVWVKVSLTFCSEWFWTVVFLISASEVMGITKVRHHIQLRCLQIYRSCDWAGRGLFIHLLSKHLSNRYLR